MSTLDKIFSGVFYGNCSFFDSNVGNGMSSREVDYLSHLNKRGKATISSIFTTLLGMVAHDAVTFIESNGIMYAKCQSSGNPDKIYYVKYDGNELKYCAQVNGQFVSGPTKTHWTFFAPLFKLINEQDQEGKAAIDALINEFKNTGSFKHSKELFIYNDLMYFSKDNGYPSSITEESFVIPSVKSQQNKNNKSKRKIRSFNPDKYTIPWDRELSKDEKALIPKYNDGVDIIVPDEVYDIAEIVKGEYESIMPVKNILLYGEAGAGKSTMARILSWGWGVPYYGFDISKNIDEVSITAGAEVQNGNLSYNLSKVVQAVEQGGVLEFREIYTAHPGVQTFLNGLLEEGELRLANGKVINRHPNCIIIGTTNVDYAGCQEFDKSTDDRFQLQAKVLPMPEEKIIEVVSFRSGNADKKLIKKLYDSWLKMREKVKQEQIDGEATMRKLIMWAKTCKYKPVIESAKITVLSGISKEEEVQEDIINSILVNQFAA